MLLKYLSNVQNEVERHIQLANRLKDNNEILTAKLMDLERELRDARSSNEHHVQEKSKLAAENTKLKERCEKLERDMDLMKRTAKETYNSSAVSNFLSAMECHFLIMADLEEITKHPSKMLEKSNKSDEFEVKEVEEAGKKYIVVICDETFRHSFANVEFVYYGQMINLNNLTQHAAFYRKEILILAENTHLVDTSPFYSTLFDICQQWKRMRPDDGEIHVINWTRNYIVLLGFPTPSFVKKPSKKITSLFSSLKSYYVYKEDITVEIILIMVREWWRFDVLNRMQDNAY